jgi:hypothetical protein
VVGVVEATGCDDPVWLNCQHRPLVTVGCSAAFEAVSWPFTLAVVSDVACLLVLLFGSAPLGWCDWAPAGRRAVPTMVVS